MKQYNKSDAQKESENIFEKDFFDWLKETSNIYNIKYVVILIA